MPAGVPGVGGPVVPGDIGTDDEGVVFRAGGIDEFGVEQAMVEADGFCWIAAVGFGGAGVVRVEDIDGVVRLKDGYSSTIIATVL